MGLKSKNWWSTIIHIWRSSCNTVKQLELFWCCFCVDLVLVRILNGNVWACCQLERHRWQVMIFNVLTLTLILAALLAHAMWMVFPRARRDYCTWMEGQADLVMWFDIKRDFPPKRLAHASDGCSLIWISLQPPQVPWWSVCCLRDLLIPCCRLASTLICRKAE